MRLVSQPLSTPNPAADVRALVHLNPDHPGFHDGLYRARRNAIARTALNYTPSQTVPEVPYSAEEHQVWRWVNEALSPLHDAKVCAPLQRAGRDLAMDPNRIPQLAELNGQLRRRSGFRMEPVSGLVRAETFLTHLGKRVFLSTQYIRHHSRPLYTPEPDIIHELTGHAASLFHPRIADLSEAFGRAVAVADPLEQKRIEHVYWYTMEFGVVEEQGELKAFGAGLLSSAGELAQFDRRPALLVWDLDDIAETPYDPTRMQPHLFVAPSFGRMLDDLSCWLATGGWRSPRVRRATG